MTMMVYHAKRTVTASRFTADLPGVMPAFPADYTLVALVEGSDLDDAFHLTNHHIGPWPMNKGVTAKVARPRSTSVGDVIVQIDEAQGSAFAFRCEPVGWKLLNPA